MVWRGGGAIALLDLLPAVLEPELYLLGSNTLELGGELGEALCGGVTILLKGGLQDIELFWGAASAVILGLELAETGETFPAVLKPLGNLCGGDAELLCEVDLLLELWISVVVEGFEECVLLGRCDSPLGLGWRMRMRVVVVVVVMVGGEGRSWGSVDKGEIVMRRSGVGKGGSGAGGGDGVVGERGC